MFHSYILRVTHTFMLWDKATSNVTDSRPWDIPILARMSTRIDAWFKRLFLPFPLTRLVSLPSLGALCDGSTPHDCHYSFPLLLVLGALTYSIDPTGLLRHWRLCAQCNNPDKGDYWWVEVFNYYYYYHYYALPKISCRDYTYRGLRTSVSYAYGGS